MCFISYLLASVNKTSRWWLTCLLLEPITRIRSLRPTNWILYYLKALFKNLKKAFFLMYLQLRFLRDTILYVNKISTLFSTFFIAEVFFTKCFSVLFKLTCFYFNHSHNKANFSVPLTMIWHSKEGKKVQNQRIKQVL